MKNISDKFLPGVLFFKHPGDQNRVRRGFNIDLSDASDEDCQAIYDELKDRLTPKISPTLALFIRIAKASGIEVSVGTERKT